MALISESLIKKELNPGKMYADFELTFLDAIDQRMQWKTISPKALLLSNGVEPIQYTVSLLQLVRQTLVEATTNAFFGPELLQTDPEFVDNFFPF